MWQHTTTSEDHGSHRVKVAVWSLDFAHVYRCRVETSRNGFKPSINGKVYALQPTLEEAQRYLETVVELELRALGGAWRAWRATKPPQCSWCAAPIASARGRLHGLCDSHYQQFSRNAAERGAAPALPPNCVPFRKQRA